MSKSRESAADLYSGLFWIVLGAAIVVSAQAMDIRAHLGGTFLTGPGFVPILLGLALCVLGFILVVRSRKAPQIGFLSGGEDISDRRALAALVLMLVYSIGLVGHIPFWLATFGFISSFIFLFNLPVSGKAGFLRLGASACATAAVTTLAVVLIFEKLFYIRLP